MKKNLTLTGPSLNAVPSFVMLPGNTEFGNLMGNMTSHPRLLEVPLRATF